MDKTSGQNYAGGEGLGGDEEASIGSKNPAVFSDEGNGDSADSGHEDRSDSNEFEAERRRFISADF